MTRTAIFLDKRPPPAHHKAYMAIQPDFARQVRDCTDRLSVVGVDALGLLFDLTAQRLVRFAAALTRHQHDAEDAVQTTLVRLAGQPRSLAKVVCPWAYI